MKIFSLKSVHQLLNDLIRSIATVLQISGNTCTLTIKKFQKYKKKYGLGQFFNMKVPSYCSIIVSKLHYGTSFMAIVVMYDCVSHSVYLKFVE